MPSFSVCPPTSSTSRTHFCAGASARSKTARSLTPALSVIPSIVALLHKLALPTNPGRAIKRFDLRTKTLPRRTESCRMSELRYRASCLPVGSLRSWRPSALGSRLPGGRVLLRCVDHVDRRNENGPTEVTLTDVVELPLADGECVPASRTSQPLPVEQPIDYASPFAGHLATFKSCRNQGRKMPKPRHDLLPRCAFRHNAIRPKGLRVKPTLHRSRTSRHARDMPIGGSDVFDAHVVRGVAPTPSQSLDQQQPASKRRCRTSGGDSLTQPALGRPILTVP